MNRWVLTDFYFFLWVVTLSCAMFKHTSQYGNSCSFRRTTFKSTSVRLIWIVIVSEKESFSFCRWKNNNSVTSVQKACHKEFGYKKRPTQQQLSLPIIKGHLRAKIGKIIVQRRKVKCQLKVCHIEKSTIYLNSLSRSKCFANKFFLYENEKKITGNFGIDKCCFK